MAADIEAMFHQVKVNTSDADSLRFPWKENIYSDDPPITLRMMVHIFGTKDCCANYAIKGTARDNYKDFVAATYESAVKSFYADDLLKSVKTKEKQLIEMMRRGGFKLTKFLSNQKEVLDFLPSTDVSGSMELGLDTDKIERALGVYWDVTQDMLTFKSNSVEAPYTKKGILRTVSSIFDPLGLLGPFITRAKIFLEGL